MLFNSFIFLFLPVALIGFYALWLPGQTWILLASIGANFVMSHYFQKYWETKLPLAKLIPLVGLVSDLGVLLRGRLKTGPRLFCNSHQL